LTILFAMPYWNELDVFTWCSRKMKERYETTNHVMAGGAQNKHSMADKEVRTESGRAIILPKLNEGGAHLATV
jgi:hypothetical protein